MKTQYIPMGSDLVASAFRRLDEQVAYLRRQVALSALFAWNYSSRIHRPGGEAISELRARSMPLPVDPLESKRWRWELALAAIVACLALCACGPDGSEPREPEISDPFRPPPELRPQIRGLHVYQVKDGQGPTREVVIVIQKGQG